MNLSKQQDGRSSRRTNNKQRTMETVLDMILQTGKEPGIDEIVEKTGISRRSVFYYFNNRKSMITEINQLVFARIAQKFPLLEKQKDESFSNLLSRFLNMRIRIFEYIAPLMRIIEEKKRENPLLMDNHRSYHQREEENIEKLFFSYFTHGEDWNRIRLLLLWIFSWNTWAFFRYEKGLDKQAYRNLIESTVLQGVNKT